MATTNSTTTHGLNDYLLDGGPENSGYIRWLLTNTGNMNKKKGLPILNHTYTLPSDADNLVVNAKLLDYNLGVGVKGWEIQGNKAQSSTGLNPDAEYGIYGHPDRYVYDYQQSYSNCGVNSCLNVLSMAGVKDIVEITSSYADYLNTAQVTTKEELVWNQETSTWETQTITTTTYPQVPVETEDEFLLWAVQNSKNDADWYKDLYQDGNLPEGYIKLPVEPDEDYCLHTKNAEDYKTVEDLKGNILEVGGTFNYNWENILEHWGVEATAGFIKFNCLEHQNTEPQTQTILKEADPDYDNMRTETTIVTVSDDIGKTITTTTTVVIYKPSAEDAEKFEEYKTIKTVETNSKVNTEVYDYLEGLAAYVADGRGIILGGYANGFYAEKGGGHAITLTGIVTGDVVTKTKVVTSTFEGETTEIENTTEEAEDIVGVYVLDTGGFLGGESSQFITLKQLYDFLSNTSYEGVQSYFDVCVTDNNIRKWADNLNLVGNNRKNVLEGNNSNNIIKGEKGNDVLFGQDGKDTLYGGADNDTLIGGTGDDVLDGGTGNDTYLFGYSRQGGSLFASIDGKSHDTIIAGKGRDVIQFNSDTPNPGESYIVQDIMEMEYQNRNGDLVIQYDTTVSKIQGVTSSENNTITVKDYFRKNLYNSIESIVESSEGTTTTYDFLTDFIQRQHIDYYYEENKGNKLTGSKFMDSITGGNKNDTISAGANNDILNGGACNDTLKGGAGDDIIYASYGNDKIYGESGENKIVYASDFSGNDTIYSGSGKDYIDLTSMTDLTREKLSYYKDGNNLVITYDKEKGNSITIASYFSKKGKTSVKYVEFANKDRLDLVNEYSTAILPNAVAVAKVDMSKSKINETITGTDGYDSLKGGYGNDVITGGYGNDTLYGGNGNDTLNGGIGCDKLYGQAGDNTYIFDGQALGYDTIYTSGNGETVLDFTGSGLTFDTIGSSGAVNTYSYTKDKNDLIINYAQDLSQDDNATVRITNYFKSKGEFTLKDGTNTIDVKNVAIYMNGDDTKANKITGSIYNDSIIGYDFNDTLKGGNGNDTIIGGKGNDNITGGTGDNTIIYNYSSIQSESDGSDIINLTKNENLKIQLSGFDLSPSIDGKTKIFDYEIVKKDLVISYIDENKKKSTVLTLKNFGTKDVTTANGSVELYNNGELVMDLREGNYLDKYMGFTPKKYSYTGNWHTEEIDARVLNNVAVSKNRGAKINAGAGNDIIRGSYYNDTINGGDGDDVIYSSYGTNKLDGGKGSDTYYIFEDKTRDILKEISTVKDTGKIAEDVDTAIICDTKENMTTNGRIWFNIDKNGNIKSDKFTIEDGTGNKVTLQGIEKIQLNGGTTDTTADDYVYDYNNDTLKSQVVAWLEKNNFADVATGLSKGIENEKLALYEIFNDYWTTEQP